MLVDGKPNTPGDKATVSFHVQAPLGRQVIANGDLEKIDTLPYGHTVWQYSLNTPVPVYTMVVGIGRLARTALPEGGCAVKCVTMSLWTHPQYAGKPFRRAGAMLGKQLTLDLTQTQKAQSGTYRIPGLGLGIDGKTVRVDVDGRKTRTVLENVAERPEKIEVDPDGWWLLKTNSVKGKQ